MNIKKTDWWRGAVIYQIYPRSFKDSNSDGIGDIRGIIEKIDYLKSLGVDALWISPFFPSPMKDFGYDVSDYCNIDPMFGTLEEFDLLIKESHARNIRIIIDQVWAHSSDEHSWFAESRSSRNNPKADWYIWSDGRPDGTPPNNWLSYFGGSAWQWDTRRCQYYLHHFLTSQPALNLRNPQLVNAIEDVARFWFDRGVDGFRLDAVQAYLCHPHLLDNPARAAGAVKPSDIPATNPLSKQLRVNSGSHPDTIDLMRRFRRITDSYPDRMLLAEVGGENSLTDAIELVQKGDRLHLAYTFNFFFNHINASKIRSIIEDAEAILDDGWLCWATSNHDVERVASRWSSANWNTDPLTRSSLAKISLALGLSLRGSFCLYQGEELGLPEAEIPFEKMQDPFGIEFYPEFKGRDGCRTPMPWEAGLKNTGFSSTENPWLPIPEEHLDLSVSNQEKDPVSTLNFLRNFLQWRKQHSALLTGKIKFHDCPENILAFTRSTENEALFCAFNLSPQVISFNLPAAKYSSANGHGFDYKWANDTVTLDGFGGIFATEK
jgi:alpha-glucosidase